MKKATDEEKKATGRDERIRFLFKDGMRKLMKNPLAVGSIIVLVAIVLMIVIVPRVVPYGYSDIVTINGVRDTAAQNMAPPSGPKRSRPTSMTAAACSRILWGTDEMGRDYFVRVVYGTKVSLIVGIFCRTSGFDHRRGIRKHFRISGRQGRPHHDADCRYHLLPAGYADGGAALRCAAGGAERDQFPLLKQLGTNMLSMFMVFALLYWTGMARMVRGQILTIKSNEYVACRESSGASAGRIIRRHILPNSISVIIITAALQVPSAIFTESFLSFIGLGVKAPMPSLGGLLANAARAGISEYSYKLIFPAMMICLITLACNLLGDGLRDAFDPKLRR